MARNRFAPATHADADEDEDEKDEEDEDEEDEDEEDEDAGDDEVDEPARCCDRLRTGLTGVGCTRALMRLAYVAMRRKAGRRL